MSADKPDITVFGLRRSGTNYLSGLLKDNFKCVPRINQNGEWKHGPVSSQSDKGLKIVIIRHILSWLPSYWRYSKERPGLSRFPDFAHFVVWSKDDKKPTHRCPALVKWSFSAGYWLWRRQHDDKRVAVVRFEDLVLRPEQTITHAAAALGIGHNDKPFSVPTKYVGPKARRAQGHDDVVKYVKDRGFMQCWTNKLVKYARAHTDPAIMQALRYDWSGKWT